MKKLDDYRKLQNVNLFDNLSKAELDPIAREAKVLQFVKDEIVCEEDSESESMFFIHSGSVTVSKQGVVLAVLKAGDYFGEMSLVTGSSRNATVVTLESSVLFEISADEFDRIFDRLPRAMYKLLVTYDARLRRHNDTVVEQFMKMKQQYEELESAHQRLLLSDKMASIGLLTAGIAHEINNPLFVIRGYLNVISESLRSGGIGDGELADITAKLDTASKSIAKLVSGIKTYVRIEKTDAVPIELNSAIQDSIDLVSFLYRQDGIEIESHGHHARGRQPGHYRSQRYRPRHRPRQTEPDIPPGLHHQARREGQWHGPEPGAPHRPGNGRRDRGRVTEGRGRHLSADLPHLQPKPRSLGRHSTPTRIM